MGLGPSGTLCLGFFGVEGFERQAFWDPGPGHVSDLVPNPRFLGFRVLGFKGLGFLKPKP